MIIYCIKTAHSLPYIYNITSGTHTVQRSVVQRLVRDQKWTLALLFFLCFNDPGSQPDGLAELSWGNLTEPSAQCENTHLLNFGSHAKYASMF